MSGPPGPLPAPAPELPAADELTGQLAQIVGQISRVMDAEGCTLFLHDPATGELWSRVMADGTHGAREIRLKVGEGIAGEVMQTGRARRIADVRSERHHSGRFDSSAFVTRSMLCVPLVNPAGVRVGVVQVLNKRGGSFTDADETLLVALNSQVAIALENARLASDLARAQKTEHELAEQLAAKHRELQDAFLKLESAKVETETNVRRIQQIRLAAVVGGVLLFAGLGLVSTRGTHLSRSPGAAKAPGGAAGAAPQVVTIAASLTRNGIPLESRFAPLRTVNVVAGLGGKVSRVAFHYGQRVARGDLLLEIDTTSEEVARRQARIESIRAEERLKELEAWREGPAVTDARRAVTRAEGQKRDAERRARETERLFSKGIVGGDERESAKRELESATLEAVAAGEVLERALAQGGETSLRIARMTLENARVAEQSIAERIAAARVLAPLSGVVLLPTTKPEPGRPSAGLATGLEVAAGSQLLQIGDVHGLSLAGALDEVEIGSVTLGQEVLVTSPGLPDLKLEGKVVARASQGRFDEGARGHRFDVLVEVPEVPAAWADRVLLGMSATLQILLGEGVPQLLVPVGAVHLEDGAPWVEKVDPKSGQPSRQAITLGLTTVDSVEVTAGLAAGDRVLVR